MSTATLEIRGRVFTETPEGIANVARQYLAADAAWRDGADTDPYPVRREKSDAVLDARKALEKTIEAHQGGRLDGFYRVNGKYLGFSRMHSNGMQLEVWSQLPGFKKGARR